MITKLKELLFARGSTRKIVFKNFLWLGVSQVGSRFIRAAITIYSARALGAAGYGVFSYAMGLSGFFIFFKNIGVDSIMTRDIAKHPEERDAIFSTGFWIEVALLVGTAFLLLVVAPHFSTVPAALTLLPVVAIMIIADDLRDFVVAFFRGVEKMEWEAAIVTAANVSVTIFGFVALALARSPMSLTIAYASASLFVTLISLGILWGRYGFDTVKHFDKKRVTPILRSAWPIAVSVLPSVFLFNVDLVMLGWWRNVAEVGVYAAAQKLIGVLAIFPGLIATSTFPAFSRFSHQGDRERMRALVERTLRIMFAFCVPVVAGGVLVARPLLIKLFGVEYGGGAGAFVVLVSTILATYPLAILSNLIFAHDLQRKLVAYPFISAGINVVFNYLLVARFGMIGAAFASLASFAVYVWLMLRLSLRVDRFTFFPRPTKIVVSTIGMALVTALLSFTGVQVLVNIGVSAVVYAALLIATRDETVDDVRSLLNP